MKQAIATTGRNLVSFTIPDAVSLRGHTVALDITIDGALALTYRGNFPPAGGLTVAFEELFRAGHTVTATTLIDGVAIATARDGTLSVTNSGPA